MEVMGKREWKMKTLEKNENSAQADETDRILRLARMDEKRSTSNANGCSFSL